MGDKYKARLDSETKVLEIVQQDPAVYQEDVLLNLLSVAGTRVDATDESGMTALMHAAYKGNVHACQLLLAHGADVNCNLHEHFYSPLMFGTMSGSVLIVNLLLESGANVSATNRNGRSAAQLGAFVGNHACVTAIKNFLPVKDLEYYTKPHGKLHYAK
jgi:ankyrin repeat protein